jgi:hypothetical protein
MYLLKLGVLVHFPFGFGPATGKNFVIKKIGETSDDEESWGYYQLQLGLRTKGFAVSQASTQVSVLHMRTGEITTPNLLTLDRCLHI